ncbi:MAG TPA: hypothetical protein VF140_09005, partial [Phycicoccus sp.]
MSEYDERDPAAPDTPEGTGGAAPVPASDPGRDAAGQDVPGAGPSPDEEPTVATGLGWPDAPGSADTEDTRPIG